MRNEKGQFIKGFPHNKGAKRSPEHLAKLIAGRINTPISEGSRLKYRLVALSRKYKPETIQKMSESHAGKNGRNGYRQPEEIKKRISEKLKGRKLPEETRRKMSLSRQGEKSILWRGGVSFEPYTTGWTNLLKSDPCAGWLCLSNVRDNSAKERSKIRRASY